MSSGGRTGQASLFGVFFASGASALIFENLWFRQAGLLLGNSVWATSIVLASFMAGLALGNALAARHGHRARRLVRLYALLELAIAGSATLVILLLPHLGALLASPFGALAGHPAALAGVRLAAAFTLMVVPATAMGATLPILVKALCRHDPMLGRVLGRLYGWNTLGAVAGILAVELLLVATLGVRGAALAAMALNLVAAAVAWWLSRSWDQADGGANIGELGGQASAWRSLRARRLLAAAFGSGAILLALEVIWFRFLALYVLSTTLALSVMLAVILTGIGLGGLIAARWLCGDAARLLPTVALGGGILSLLAYQLFFGGTPVSQDWLDALVHALRLMLPVSVASGILFTLLAEAARREITPENRVVGLVALANTVGAMTGALCGGFVLLPLLGVERSLFGLAAGYGVVALLLPRQAPPSPLPPRRLVARAVPLLFVALLVSFPFGRMERYHARRTLIPFLQSGAKVVAFREGRTETIAYLRHDYAGLPLAYRLVTNGYSMSSSYFNAQRYMKLFVYWAVAVHPAPRRALLICYGVGQTAKALTDTAELEVIDVVDISAEILELGRLAYPDPGSFPLDDPRVRTKIEDGRFHLQTSGERYDLITGEPPPPQAAGVVNLYTREYFQLVHDALNQGGIVTYWLPVHQLSVEDAKVIIAAFCQVFDDCSLWNGFGFDWMLAGSRGASGGVSEARFTAQWRDPTVAAELAALGFEQPEQLGALFMGDAPVLRQLVAGTPPLTDDWPQRLANRYAPLGGERYLEFIAWTDTSRAREAFARSELIRSLWPPGLRERSLELFAAQRVINRLGVDASGWVAQPFAAYAADLHYILTETSLETPVLWMLGSSARHLAILDQLGGDAEDNPTFDYARGVRALAERRYDEAVRRFASTAAQLPDRLDLRLMQLFALALAGRGDEARALAQELRPRTPHDHDHLGYWRLLAERYGI